MAIRALRLVPYNFRIPVYRRQSCAVRYCVAESVSNYTMESRRKDGLQLGFVDSHLRIRKLSACEDTLGLEWIVSLSKLIPKIPEDPEHHYVHQYSN